MPSNPSEWEIKADIISVQKYLYSDIPLGYMSIPLVSKLNKYGKAALLCTALGLGGILLGVALYLSVGLIVLAFLILIRAMHVNDEPGRYPQDRESNLSERERRRQRDGS